MTKNVAVEDEEEKYTEVKNEMVFYLKNDPT